VLLVAGPRDPLVPAGTLEQTLAVLEQARPRASLLASRISGLSANYGHLDLLLGRNARRDIYPFIAAWLDRHAGVELPPHRPEPPGQWSEQLPGGPPPETAPEPPPQPEPERQADPYEELKLDAGDELFEERE
jgi:hypothetical protein